MMEEHYHWYNLTQQMVESEKCANALKHLSSVYISSFYFLLSLFFFKYFFASPSPPSEPAPIIELFVNINYLQKRQILKFNFQTILNLLTPTLWYLI